ncbi:hypothetical protein [Alicyclobacillus contaminans]|uniref:hypothetical protein n=1 Tax=Alicyclobacillus contaminans TaxID=392016 RepID=UPI0012EB3B0C|nr:hypothetical protein [Alicyclobacillus contaminans]
MATLVNGPVAANQDSDVAEVGNIDTLTVFLDASGAATVTVYTSPDEQNWYVAQAWSPTGAASDAVNVAPAPFVKVQSSAAITLKAQVYGVGGW